MGHQPYLGSHKRDSVPKDGSGLRTNYHQPAEVTPPKPHKQRKISRTQTLAASPVLAQLCNQTSFHSGQLGLSVQCEPERYRNPKKSSLPSSLPTTVECPPLPEASIGLSMQAGPTERPGLLKTFVFHLGSWFPVLQDRCLKRETPATRHGGWRWDAKPSQAGLRIKFQMFWLLLLALPLNWYHLLQDPTSSNTKLV